MITLDTSALYELLDRLSPNHAAVTRELETDGGPFVVPAPILAEIAYLVESRLQPRVLDAFLEDLDTEALRVDCCDGDLGEVRRLVRRYSDLRLGFADACVIACAERNGGHVLSLDRRDFGVVAREGRITLLPN